MKTLNTFKKNLKLDAWSKHGFPELGDQRGVGIGLTVGSVMGHPQFRAMIAERTSGPTGNSSNGEGEEVAATVEAKTDSSLSSSSSSSSSAAAAAAAPSSSHYSSLDPHLPAREYWVSENRNPATNGALMRTAITAVPHFWDAERTARITLNFARITHAGPRSDIACLMHTGILRRLLQRGLFDDSGQDRAVGETGNDGNAVNSDLRSSNIGEQKGHEASVKTDIAHLAARNNQIPSTSEIQSLIDGEREAALRYLHAEYEARQTDAIDRLSESHLNELLPMISATDISLLHLDERGIGYVYKCVAGGTWALRYMAALNEKQLKGTNDAEDVDGKKLQYIAKKTLHTLIMEGGDADTNGAVAGALVGSVLGLHQLPRDWIGGLAYLDWLLDRIHPICAAMGLEDDSLEYLLAFKSRSASDAEVSANGKNFSCVCF